MNSTTLILLLLGWALHICMAGNQAQTNSLPPDSYVRSHFWSILTGLLGCMTLAVAAPQIPHTLIDMDSYISVLGAGFGSTALVQLLLNMKNPFKNGVT